MMIVAAVVGWLVIGWIGAAYFWTAPDEDGRGLDLTLCELIPTLLAGALVGPFLGVYALLAPRINCKRIVLLKGRSR